MAAHGATPARWAITAMPATAQTLPGRYLPRLDTVQMRAADQPSRRWPQPASIIRQATMSSAYIEPDDDRAQQQPAGSIAPIERLRPQLGPVAHQAADRERDDGERRAIHCAARSHARY